MQHCRDSSSSAPLSWFRNSQHCPALQPGQLSAQTPSGVNRKQTEPQLKIAIWVIESIMCTLVLHRDRWPALSRLGPGSGQVTWLRARAFLPCPGFTHNWPLVEAASPFYLASWTLIGLPSRCQMTISLWFCLHLIMGASLGILWRSELAGLFLSSKTYQILE